MRRLPETIFLLVVASSPAVSQQLIYTFPHPPGPAMVTMAAAGDVDGDGFQDVATSAQWQQGLGIQPEHAFRGIRASSCSR